MKNCASCGAELSDDPNVCPNCGNFVNAETSMSIENKKPWALYRLSDFV